MSARSLAAGLALALLAGCGPAEHFDDAVCPPEGTELTYENFGKHFMGAHCQSCHASAAEDRKGAPSGYEFDTYEDVVRHKERIYERAAGDNTSMPTGPDDPPVEERDDLAEWIACGAPR